MAHDEALARILRAALVPRAGVTEKRMSGGLAFFVDGHMLCGVHPGGAMVRVGKTNEPDALALDGVTPMALTGRTMGGFVDVSAAALADPARRERLLGLAWAFVATLPPK